MSVSFTDSGVGTFGPLAGGTVWEGYGTFGTWSLPGDVSLGGFDPVHLPPESLLSFCSPDAKSQAVWASSSFHCLHRFYSSFPRALLFCSDMDLAKYVISLPKVCSNWPDSSLTPLFFLPLALPQFTVFMPSCLQPRQAPPFLSSLLHIWIWFFLVPWQWAFQLSPSSILLGVSHRALSTQILPLSTSHLLVLSNLRTLWHGIVL